MPSSILANSLKLHASSSVQPNNYNGGGGGGGGGSTIVSCANAKNGNNKINRNFFIFQIPNLIT